MSNRKSGQMLALDSEIEVLEKQFNQAHDKETDEDSATTSTGDEGAETSRDIIPDGQDDNEELGDTSDLTSDLNTDGQDSDEEDHDDQEDNEEEADGEKNSKTKKRKYTDWKTRYKTLRSHHDSTVFDLRQDLAQLKEQVVSVNKVNLDLNKRIVELSAGKGDEEFIKNFSDEDKEVLGVQAIEALNKATRSAIEPLKKQLDEEKQKRLKDQEREAKRFSEENKRKFIERFTALVPNYTKIDKSPEFIKFMGDIDPASGYTRVDLFRRAATGGDVVRAAGFYKEFLSTKGSSQSHLIKKVTPTGRNMDTSQQRLQSQKTKDMVSRADINKFYDDVVRGKYKGKESLANEIEAKFEKAVLEGRVR